MSSTKASHALRLPLENHILAVLPKEEYGRLLPYLSHVRLPQGRMLWDVGDRIRHAYFPLTGMVSLLSITGDKSTVEVGMIGSEGCAGTSALLRLRNAPYRTVSQLSTTALRINIEALEREFMRAGRLQDLLLRYTHTLLTQVSQSASCNRFHTTEERLCRWLLISSDRAKSDALDLTQGFLSEMIGCPRTSVTAIVARIQRIGLVRYSRGRVRILDRGGLERVSCECYRAISEELKRYLAG